MNQMMMQKNQEDLKAAIKIGNIKDFKEALNRVGVNFDPDLTLREILGIRKNQVCMTKILVDHVGSENIDETLLNVGLACNTVLPETILMLHSKSVRFNLEHLQNAADNELFEDLAYIGIPPSAKDLTNYAAVVAAIMKTGVSAERWKDIFEVNVTAEVAQILTNGPEDPLAKRLNQKTEKRLAGVDNA